MEPIRNEIYYLERASLIIWESSIYGLCLKNKQSTVVPTCFENLLQMCYECNTSGNLRNQSLLLNLCTAYGKIMKVALAQILESFRA